MSPFKVESTGPAERLVRPFQRFARLEAAGGIMLIACLAAALIWANSAWADSYHALWDTVFTVGVGSFSISKPLLLWINDGLMAVFFFVVGLEIKRELLVGELASARKAALPIAAAVGGMIVPALIFTALNRGTPEVRGWAIPMATDIAFALGILALLGRRVPLSLKVFLAAVAIVDDLGAVLVIAIFYTAEVKTAYLVAGGVVWALALAANIGGFRRPVIYLVLGIALWVLVLKSGVHATIAGVLLAAAIPARRRVDPKDFVRDCTVWLARAGDALERPGVSGYGELNSAVHKLEDACRSVDAPLLRFEHALVPWSAFLVMPIFALANAGVSLQGFGTSIGSRLGLGIVLGLVLGKLIGLTAFTWGVRRMGLGALPEGVRWVQIAGLGMLAGIGFTMSMFIASLAFKDDLEQLNMAKSGIFIGSFVAGLLGFVILRLTSPLPGPKSEAPIDE